VESSRSGASPGSTSLSVTKVPPDCAAHIPPSLGGHPVTVSLGEAFSLRRKQASARGRSDTPPPDDHTETNVTTYEVECDAAPARCLVTVHRMSSVHKQEKTLREFSADVCTLQDTCALIFGWDIYACVLASELRYSVILCPLLPLMPAYVSAFGRSH
jgi:hypothetical protein